MSAFDSSADAALFDVEAPPPVTLADRFGFIPFSVIDRRAGEWTDRKRRWLSLGIQSEVGRGEGLTYDIGDRQDVFSQAAREIGTTSVFDPVLCELVYRWFTRRGDTILDPFAGGSVRGVVASTLERNYYGIDLRDEQVAANIAQINLCHPDYTPRWQVGDSTNITSYGALGGADLIFTCPPYGDLERYSDDPRDLSNMKWEQFCLAQIEAVMLSTAHLRTNRFAVWVTSEIRDKAGTVGAYRGLKEATIRAFRRAGLHYYNDAVILDPVGSVRLRAGNAFAASRKFGRVHQYLLVFVKGDPKAATQRLEAVAAA